MFDKSYINNSKAIKFDGSFLKKKLNIEDIITIYRPYQLLTDLPLIRSFIPKLKLT